jgi:hypothetical protein
MVFFTQGGQPLVSQHLQCASSFVQRGSFAIPRQAQSSLRDGEFNGNASFENGHVSSETHAMTA